MTQDDVLKTATQLAQSSSSKNTLKVLLEYLSFQEVCELLDLALSFMDDAQYEAMLADLKKTTSERT